MIKTSSGKWPLKWRETIICGKVAFHFIAILLVSGISGKSQIMFAMVFTTRYLDLFTTYVSLYNSVMKVFFIVSSCATIYLMYSKFRATYDHNHDSFRVEFLVVPMAGLAVLVNHEFSLLEVLIPAIFQAAVLN